MPFTREHDVNDVQLEIYPGFREDMDAVQDAREASGDGTISPGNDQAWTAYTPVLLSDAAATDVGSTGTIEGKFKTIGTVTFFSIEVVLSASGLDVGSDAEIWNLSLPVEATDVQAVGVAYAMDAAPVGHVGVWMLATTTTLEVWSTADVIAWNHETPFTWAATDTFIISGSYETA